MAYVFTIDQRHSRSSPDLVEPTLERLAAVPTLRPFERTAGDEFQGILDHPDAAVEAVLDLLHQGRWSIGIGIGPVETPLPASTRAGRGDAFLLARKAVEAAKRHPQHVVVRGSDAELAQQLGALLSLLGVIYGNRTRQAWEAISLIRDGLTQSATATKLGISRQAVGQRLSAAHWREEREAIPAVKGLFRAASTSSSG